jgi:hypothetical protein
MPNLEKEHSARDILQNEIVEKIVEIIGNLASILATSPGGSVKTTIEDSIQRLQYFEKILPTLSDSDINKITQRIQKNEIGKNDTENKGFTSSTFLKAIQELTSEKNSEKEELLALIRSEFPSILGEDFGVPTSDQIIQPSSGENPNANSVKKMDLRADYY